MQGIVINSGNTSDGTLDLSDRGYTKAQRTESIIWGIKQHSNVGSIDAIAVKATSRNIFSSLESIDPNNRKWEGVIDHFAPYIDCEYTIWWKDLHGHGPYKHDPKIAVRPPGGVAVLGIAGLIQKAIFMLLGIFSFYKLFSRKKKNKE